MATKTFLHGKPVDDAIEVHEHISPQMTYVKVLAALFVLTALTYAVSYASLGPASLWVAMGVAFVKATLVCMFFMHLKYDERFHVFAFLSTIIFVTIFFLFTIFDLQSRTRLNDEQGTMFRVQQGGDWNDAKATNKAEAQSGGGQGEGKAEGKAEGKVDAKPDPKAPDPTGKADPNKRP